eukprot:TRINITY_DN7355_c0_g1_i1.p2 TRINITY_DN7355_c0_g1~~TRINITY_DN7355_c0_g1_i1.p2  ORF type:complete len:101 (+),score=8.47 TRINITY_DN7355_c0_g1_i1:31-333(+)
MLGVCKGKDLDAASRAGFWTTLIMIPASVQRALRAAFEELRQNEWKRWAERPTVRLEAFTDASLTGWCCMLMLDGKRHVRWCAGAERSRRRRKARCLGST